MQHKRFITALQTAVFGSKEPSYTISVAWLMALKVDYISYVGVEGVSE
jgi:hypothetical protein